MSEEMSFEEHHHLQELVHEYQEMVKEGHLKNNELHEMQELLDEIINEQNHEERANLLEEANKKMEETIEMNREAAANEYENNLKHAEKLNQANEKIREMQHHMNTILLSHFEDLEQEEVNREAEKEAQSEAEENEQQEQHALHPHQHPAREIERYTSNHEEEEERHIATPHPHPTPPGTPKHIDDNE